MKIMENNEVTHWQCPKCNKVIEINYDLCWNCQYEKTGNEVLLKDEQISSEIIEDENITQKEIPKSPVILNIIGALALLGFFPYIFGLKGDNSIVLFVTILLSVIALVGFLGIIWMKKWGLYLYSAFCIMGYLALFSGEQPLIIIYLIVPTIIVIWGFANYKKMV